MSPERAVKRGELQLVGGVVLTVRWGGDEKEAEKVHKPASVCETPACQAGHGPPAHRHGELVFTSYCCDQVTENVCLSSSGDSIQP